MPSTQTLRRLRKEAVTDVSRSAKNSAGNSYSGADTDFSRYSVCYRDLWELRVKSKVLIRIIFCTLPNGDVLLLHGFVKRQKRDTMQALEQSIRILDALREHPERAVEYKIKEEKAS